MSELTLLDRFRIEGALNGSSSSFLCVDLESQEKMVVKIISAAGFSESQLDEALRTLAHVVSLEFSNPSIVHQHLSFLARSRVFCVMDYHELPSLEKLCEPDVFVSPACFGQIAHSLISSVASLHRRNVYHLNIHPRNILVTRENSVVLVGIGFSLFTRSSIENGCPVHGFIAPELISGSYCGPLCDVWSVGCVLYRLVFGQDAFSSTDQRSLRNSIVNWSRPSFSQLHPQVAELLVSIFVPVEQRPTADDLLQLPVFDGLRRKVTANDLLQELEHELELYRPSVFLTESSVDAQEAEAERLTEVISELASKEQHSEEKVDKIDLLVKRGRRRLYETRHSIARIEAQKVTLRQMLADLHDEETDK